MPACTCVSCAGAEKRVQRPLSRLKKGSSTAGVPGSTSQPSSGGREVARFTDVNDLKVQGKLNMLAGELQRLSVCSASMCAAIHHTVFYLHVALTPLAPCIAEVVGLDNADLFLSAIDSSYPIISSIRGILAQQPFAMRQLFLADRAFCKCVMEITDAAIDRGVQQLHKGDHLAACQRILVAGKLRVLNDVPEEDLVELLRWQRMREGDGVRATGLGNTKSKIRAYLSRVGQAAVQDAARERLNNIVKSYINPP